MEEKVEQHAECKTRGQIEAVRPDSFPKEQYSCTEKERGPEKNQHSSHPIIRTVRILTWRNMEKVEARECSTHLLDRDERLRRDHRIEKDCTNQENQPSHSPPGWFAQNGNRKPLLRLSLGR